MKTYIHLVFYINCIPHCPENSEKKQSLWFRFIRLKLQGQFNPYRSRNGALRPTGEGKVFPLQARLWPRGWVEVQLYSSMTTALEGGVWAAARPGLFYPRERPGIHCTGGWVGPRAGLDGRKILPHRDSISEPSSPKPVAIPTELPGPHGRQDAEKLNNCDSFQHVMFLEIL